MKPEVMASFIDALSFLLCPVFSFPKTLSAVYNSGGFFYIYRLGTANNFPRALKQSASVLVVVVLVFVCICICPCMLLYMSTLSSLHLLTFSVVLAE